MNREAAYAALFSLLSGLKTAGTVKIADRRVKLLSQMNGPELPALFMAVDHQGIKPSASRPVIRTYGAKVYLYAANPDKHTSADIALNGLIDAVEAILLAPPGQTQTLGGVVAHAWIEGTIEIFPGALGERAAAIIPIQMLVP